MVLLADFKLPEFALPKLAQSEYLSKAENIVPAGNSGTPKSHIAIALGRAAYTQAKRMVFFFYTGECFAGSKHGISLESLGAQALKPGLGYLALDKKGVKPLFNAFNNQYKRKFTLMTTNLPFRQWESILQDSARAIAQVDRFTHHCHIIEMSQLLVRTKPKRREECPPLPETAFPSEK